MAFWVNPVGSPSGYFYGVLAGCFGVKKPGSTGL